METVIDGVEYVAKEQLGCDGCDGCVAKYKAQLCIKLPECREIIWLTKEDVRRQAEVNKAFGHQMPLFPEIEPPVTSEEEEAFKDLEHKQVGGNHYFNPIQPWDIIRAWDLNYWEGNVVKYVLRHKGKGKIEDLEKAKHYLEYLIEHYDELF